MRKICIFLLALMMLLFGVACSSKHLNSDEIPESSSNGNIVYPEGERRLFTLSSYTEYLDFLKKSDLSDEFVTYDQIKELGTFKSFVASNYYLCSTDAERFENCSYWLIDANGKNIYVDIWTNNAYERNLENLYKGKDEENPEFMENRGSISYVPIESNSSDLRVCEAVDNKIDDTRITVFTKQIGDMTYLYRSNGELNCIVWDSNGTHMSLRTTGLFSNYPTNEKQTVISKLLNHSTAEKEVQEIVKKVTSSER